MDEIKNIENRREKMPKKKVIHIVWLLNCILGVNRSFVCWIVSSL